MHFEGTKMVRLLGIGDWTWVARRCFHHVGALEGLGGLLEKTLGFVSGELGGTSEPCRCPCREE